MSKISKVQFSFSIVWKLLQQFSSTIVSLLLAIILARLLNSSDYGIIAITTIFINFSDIFVQSGLNTALIQKKDAEIQDFTSAMVLSAIIALILYVVLFFVSPYISAYYNVPILEKILRLMGIIVFFNGENAILSAILIREMRFKPLFWSNLIGNIISGVIGVIMAYIGYGVWALVIQKLLSQILLFIILLIILKWETHLYFSFKRIKYLLQYSLNVLGSSFIAFVSDNSYTAIIGKSYSSQDLGYCNKADNIPSSTVLNSITALMSVLLPTFSSYQDNLVEMKIVTRKIVKTTTFIIFPLIFGIAATSDNLIIVLFSDKWLLSSPLMQAMCFWYLTIPILQILGQVFYAIGITHIRFNMELIKMTLTLLVVFGLVFVLKVNLVVLLLAKGMISIIIVLLSSLYSKKYLDYSFSEQIKDMSYPFIYSCLMFILVYLVSLFNISVFIELPIQFFLGIFFYIGISICLKNDSLYEIISIIKQMLVKSH